MSSPHYLKKTEEGGMFPFRDEYKTVPGHVNTEKSTNKDSKIFSPLTIRGMTLENRLIVSPMCMYSARDGVPNDFHLAHLSRFAMGGFGLVFTEATAISSEGRISPGCPGMWNDEQEAAWKRIVDLVHELGGKIGIQMAHAGRKASTGLRFIGLDKKVEPQNGGWTPIGPSPLEWADTFIVPKEATLEDLEKVKEDTVAFLERAKRVGFDVVELHAAHGYLISSFLSPIANERTDEYGGSLESKLTNMFPTDLSDRARLFLDTVKLIRQHWEKPLFVRYSATEWVEEGGFKLEDAVKVGQWLEEAGADLLDVSSGGVSKGQKITGYGPGFQVPFSQQVKAAVKIPVGAVGRLSNAQLAESVLQEGKADVIFVGTGALKNPNLPYFFAAQLGVDVDWLIQVNDGKKLPADF